MLVICGIPAAGKSHLAHTLAEISGLPHLSSDVTRKRLAGIRPRQRAGGAVYSAESNRLTYAELGRLLRGTTAVSASSERRKMTLRGLESTAKSRQLC